VTIAAGIQKKWNIFSKEFTSLQFIGYSRSWNFACAISAPLTSDHTILISSIFPKAQGLDLSSYNLSDPSINPLCRRTKFVLAAG